MNKNIKKDIIKAGIAILIIILIILTAGIIWMKYEVEGETNIPFKLSKIILVSTAEGVEKENSEETWNLDIIQNNDLHFTIEKNDNTKDTQLIEKVIIDNIQITSEPKKGTIYTYMPNSLEGRTFSYTKDYMVQTNKIEYKASTKTNIKALEIGNQGGTIVASFVNKGIGEYISNDDEEIKHDGSLLNKINVNQEDLKFSVNFDIIIQIKNIKYKTNIQLDLPCGEIQENGKAYLDITDNFVFKRI